MIFFFFTKKILRYVEAVSVTSLKDQMYEQSLF